MKNQKLFFPLMVAFYFLASNLAWSQVDTLLKVGVKTAPPFVIKNDDGGFSGLSVDLWEEIVSEINLADSSYNVQFEYVEYDLTGLVEAVEKGEIALGINPLTVTRERIEKMDFSQPFYISSVGVAVLNSETSNLLLILKNIFSLDFLKAVLVLFAVIFFVGILIWLVEKKANDQFDNNIWKGLGDGIWWSAVTMTTVGYGDKSPQTIAGRIMSLIWMFAAIIMISGLTASIASSLTVETMASQIKSLDDLKTVNLGSVKGSSSQMMLEENGVRNSREFVDVPSALQAVSDGWIETFVYDKPIMQYYIVENNLRSQVNILPFPLSTDYYSFAFPKKSEFLPLVNPYLVGVINSPFWKDELNRYLPE